MLSLCHDLHLYMQTKGLFSIELILNIYPLIQYHKNSDEKANITI